MQKLILHCPLAPGDVLTLTAAVESLHVTYPKTYKTDVRTPVPAVWQHNPHITPIADDDPKATKIKMHYENVHKSDQTLTPFLAGYTLHLGEQLKKPLSLTTNRPHLYLADDEKQWINQIREHVTHSRDVPFWIVNAGVKSDYTLKQWPVEHYQQVIDRTRGRIQWVQIGEAGHDHPDLKGVIDMRGKTDTRQLIRLVYHAAGGLGPVTFLQHLCAAWQKPYICLVGGREPVPWIVYPLQHTLHTIGQLDCCRTRACWKSRVVPIGKGQDDKNSSLCEQPILGLQKPVGKCMALIQPEEVLQILQRLAA